MKYLLTAAITTFALWFYYQVDTYPYKVARWFQPLEAGVVSVAAKRCELDSSLVNLFVDHAVKVQGAYSVQVAFLSDKKQLASCYAGYKNELFGVPVNPSHRYRYASSSKLITTAIIFDLIHHKRIDINEPLIDFFPELKEFADERIPQITVSHLLNHTAGFNRLTLSGDPMFLRRNTPWCPQNISRLESLKLAFNPGEKQIYSNLGYCLLGEIIHRVSGESYRDYAERRFSLASRNIKFINDYYYDDEVRYDYRYEEWFNDSYLKLFDFNALSSSAGLSGSAEAFAYLLWDIHHQLQASPFYLDSLNVSCDLKKPKGCLQAGVFHYQPEPNSLMIHYHDGYLPGSKTIAIVDSFGGVLVLAKSGADSKKDPENEWIRWAYKRLSFYYALQGNLSTLAFITTPNK